jgi:Rnl2 family RNA ligase
MTTMDPERPSTAWSFTGYERIAESLERWIGDDEAAYRALAHAEWIVTEKIHGANFCFVTDGVETRAAKRKAFLDADEDFFGHRAMLERNAGAVRRVFALAQARDARITRVLVHGELFGGGYPHPDVPVEPSVQPVQTGCFYSPRIELCAFDLRVLHAGAEEGEYADYDEAAAIFAEAGLFHARPLFRGSYEDAVAFPIGFESHIPALLGLPPIPGNKAEGVVIKPVRPVVVPRRAGTIRPVIKRKIPEFSEDARFHQAEKWVAPKVTGGALEQLLWEVYPLVTEARLDAAISKIGRPRPGDAAQRAQIVTLLIEDLTTEIRERHPSPMSCLGPVEAAALASAIAGEAGALVELYLPVESAVR